jgi:LysM repeat protein
MRSSIAIGLAAAFPALLVASEASGQSPCGSEATVAAGETLADVAERCDVSLGALFDANPDVRSTDVATGTRIAIPAAGKNGVLDRAGSAFKQAGQEIENAATRAGQSVSEYLSDNPDLNRDILEWGEWLGLPGVAPQAQGGADVVVSPDTGRPGETVTIRAVGLKGDTEVRIGAGPPRSEYEILERARTTRDGRLEATIQVPEWSADPGAIVFVVETDRVRLTSEPFKVTKE